MSGINIDNSTLAAAVAQHVLDSLDEEARNKLITDAIATLAEPKKESWSSKASTPIQDAFDAAVQRLVHRAVTEIIEADPRYAEAVRNLVAKMFDEMISRDIWENTELRSAIGSAIATAIYKSRD